MAVYSTRLFLVLLCISVIVGLVGVSLTQSTLSRVFPGPPQVSNLQDHRVWYLGADPLLSEMVTRMRSLGVSEVNELNPPELGSNEILSKVATQDSVIMFDGAWIGQHMDENSTRSFLNVTSSQRAKIVAVGGPTSTLFDGLNRAGVYDFPDGRNPGHFNSPMAGFRLKTAFTPTGTSYQYESILFSNTMRVDTLIEALDGWIS